MRIWFPVVCSLAAAWAAEKDPANVFGAATNAVAAIQKSQQNWYKNQNCASCHHQVFPALAFRAAREHGIPVDERAARTDAVAAFDYFSKLDRAVEYSYIIDPALNDGYAMLAADAEGVRPSLVTAVYARHLAARQEADGRWDTGDMRPPQSYSAFTSTAVAVRALQLYSHPTQRAAVKSRIARARTWLLSHEPHATEERAMQVLGVHWAGADQAWLSKSADALAAMQHSDGGWGSLDGRPADAYSTGEALIALHRGAGLPVTSSAYRKGVEFLLRTQAPDGTWHVESRIHPPAPVSPPYFETGYPYGHDQFISVMGASLAVIALADSLGPARPVGLELQEATPRPIEPWVETLLFGSAADVRGLLDRGLDPNSASTSGGLTALMLAAPDVEKMKLLIERGANVDARAKNRYSALLVTAQYPDSAAAINLLLDHGAKVRLPKGQGAPLFNAHPIFLAAFSGNAEAIPRLRKEGDRVDDSMSLLGLFPVSPIVFLASSPRTNEVRALLDAGVPPDIAGDDGMTPLSFAVLSNRVDMARLLIERGADVNHVDKNGMTPLLYAASIDFGDSAMIDFLLRSGAKADARTPQGLSAADLARKYKHSHLLASLR